MCIFNKKLFLALIPFMWLSCVRDNFDDCGVYLEFIFDYNMEYADSFHPQVKTVDVFVFDDEDRLLLHKYAESSELVNRNQMYLTEDLTFGTYKVITVGGQSEQIRFITSTDAKSGDVSLKQVMLALQRTSNDITFEFPHVWYGETVIISYDVNRAVWPVHLVRNTNKFNMMLQEIDPEEIRQPETPPYTFEIITPEGAMYGYDNRPVKKELLSYHPYSLILDDDPKYTSVGRLNTMRLLDDGEDDDYQLVIREVETQEAIWSCDLINMLNKARPTQRPDGTTLPMQEYLDRKGEWDIKILYRDIIEGSNKQFVAVAIDVNGWILWLTEMEV